MIDQPLHLRRLSDVPDCTVIYERFKTPNGFGDVFTEDITAGEAKSYFPRQYHQSTVQVIRALIEEYY